MTPEQKARQKIDQQLDQCGWIVQDYRQMDISAGRGVAVREFPLSTGEADYLLYADAKAIGVIGITCRVALQQSPTLFRRTGSSVAGWLRKIKTVG